MKQNVTGISKTNEVRGQTFQNVSRVFVGSGYLRITRSGQAVREN